MKFNNISGDPLDPRKEDDDQKRERKKTTDMVSIA